MHVPLMVQLSVPSCISTQRGCNDMHALTIESYNGTKHAVTAKQFFKTFLSVKPGTNDDLPTSSKPYIILVTVIHHTAYPNHV